MVKDATNEHDSELKVREARAAAEVRSAQEAEASAEAQRVRLADADAARVRSEKREALRQRLAQEEARRAEQKRLEEEAKAAEIQRAIEAEQQRLEDEAKAALAEIEAQRVAQLQADRLAEAQRLEQMERDRIAALDAERAEQQRLIDEAAAAEEEEKAAIVRLALLKANVTIDGQHVPMQNNPLFVATSFSTAEIVEMDFRSPATKQEPSDSDTSGLANAASCADQEDAAVLDDGYDLEASTADAIARIATFADVACPASAQSQFSIGDEDELPLSAQDAPISDRLLGHLGLGALEPAPPLATAASFLNASGAALPTPAYANCGRGPRARAQTTLAVCVLQCKLHVPFSTPLRLRFQCAEAGQGVATNFVPVRDSCAVFNETVMLPLHGAGLDGVRVTLETCETSQAEGTVTDVTFNSSAWKHQRISAISESQVSVRGDPFLNSKLLDFHFLNAGGDLCASALATFASDQALAALAPVPLVGHDAASRSAALPVNAPPTSSVHGWARLLLRDIAFVDSVVRARLGDRFGDIQNLTLSVTVGHRILQAITVPARRVVSLDQEFCFWVPECKAEQLDLRVSAYLHAGVVWASRDLVAEWAAGGVTIAAPPPFKSLPDMWRRAANRRFQFVAACALAPDSAAKRRLTAPTPAVAVVAAHLGVSLTWQSPASLMSE